MDYYDGNTVTALWNYAQHSRGEKAYATGYDPSTPGAFNVQAFQPCWREVGVAAERRIRLQGTGLVQGFRLPRLVRGGHGVRDAAARESETRRGLAWSWRVQADGG